MIWLGTFVTAEEASESYKSKKLVFEELVMAKNAKKGQKFEKSDQESSCSDDSEQKSLMGADEKSNSSNGFEEKSNLFAGEDQESLMGDSENTNSCNGVEEKSNLFTGEESDEEMLMGSWVKISEDKQVKFSRKLGVPVVDNYGFLLGEFSVLDDLSIYM
ncbi:hypothetical protein HAX54_031805 [Datura stramonium]|uniref:Uncharacterized protein n=1 Tax=Datura stramonium TaxID=4076 RepID=A0ABS8VD98_DATST|nr:hypothetical protein [Datura stramonium]